MQTIAEQLGITKFPLSFVLKDTFSTIHYRESENGDWHKTVDNAKKQEVYYVDNTGFWIKREYDKFGYIVDYKDSNGYWWKRTYDEEGRELSFEKSELFDD